MSSTITLITEGALGAGSLPTLSGLSLGFLYVDVPVLDSVPTIYPAAGNRAVGYVGRPVIEPTPDGLERRARYVAAAVGVNVTDEDEREATRIAAVVALALDE